MFYCNSNIHCTATCGYSYLLIIVNLHNNEVTNYCIAKTCRILEIVYSNFLSITPPHRPYLAGGDLGELVIFGSYSPIVICSAIT